MGNFTYKTTKDYYKEDTEEESFTIFIGEWANIVTAVITMIVTGSETIPDDFSPSDQIGEKVELNFQ